MTTPHEKRLKDALFTILEKIEEALHSRNAWTANFDDYREALTDIGLVAGQAVLETIPESDQPTFQELLDNAAEELLGACLPGADAPERFRAAQFFLDAARERKRVQA